MMMIEVWMFLTVILVTEANNLDILYREAPASYSILAGGEEVLVNTDLSVFANLTHFTCSDGSLVQREETITNSSDKHGKYREHRVVWDPADLCLSTSERIYDDDFIITSMNFSCSLSGTAITSKNAKNLVSSSYPVFKKPEKTGLSFLSFGGFMSGWAAATTGSLDTELELVRGGELGGPILFFNAHIHTYILVSPLNNFMVSNMEVEAEGFRFGLMGSVEGVPGDTQMKTVLVWADSLRGVFEKWGRILLAEGGKEFRAPDDVVSNYLGYWNDNGAFYYYNTIPQTNYEETIVNISKHMKERSLPVKYINYDSWFYFKGNDLGTKNWTAMEDVFPSGLPAVYNRTTLKVVAHNRYWATDNVYARENGGNYNFIIEQNNKRALPTDPEFWKDLFQEAKSWGLDVYEQDWQDRQFMQMNRTHTDFSLGRDWLLQMGEGASLSNITIQYCMSMPREVLQSSEIDAVRRVRSSGDYILSKDNWKIGLTGLVTSSLGLASFKNVFWSSSTNPGNKFYYNCMEVSNSSDPNEPWNLQYRYTGYYNKTKSGHTCISWYKLNMNWIFPFNDLERDGCRSIPGSEFANGKPFCFYSGSSDQPIHTWMWEECDIPICEVDCKRPGFDVNLPLCDEYTEPNPNLQATVSLLSGGGVGFGDQLALIDEELVRSTCRSDGTLLRISKPLVLTPLQLTHMANSCPGYLPHSCGGEIWSGSEIISGMTFNVILVAENRMSTSTSVEMLGIFSEKPFLLYTEQEDIKLISPNHEEIPLGLQKEGEFTMLYTSPGINLANHTIYILGELNKISFVSKQRIASIEQGDSITVSLVGSPGENVSFSFFVLEKDERIESVCELDATGNGKLVILEAEFQLFWLC